MTDLDKDRRKRHKETAGRSSQPAAASQLSRTGMPSDSGIASRSHRPDGKCSGSLGASRSSGSHSTLSVCKR